MVVVWLLAFVIGVALIVWGAEAFAEHLGAASVRLGVSAFALALLLAGAEPEELATVVVASLRGSPSIALGDVIGANVAICLVALGVGAVIAPLPFPARVMRYAGLAVPLGVVAAWFAWSGVVTRLHGVVLLGLYVVYVGAIWLIERRPPELGEVHELEEAKERAGKAGPRGRIGRDLFLVIAGVGAMVAGAVLLVEAVRRLANVESTQTLVGLTLVGFATAFELVALAWSASRRGASEAVVAGVVGSFAYNVTMTLGAGALANPLLILDAESLHRPWLAMLAAISLVMVLAARKGRLDRSDGVVLLTAYPAFILMVLLT